MKNQVLKAYCLYVMHKNVFFHPSTGEVNPDYGYMVLADDTWREYVDESEFDVNKLYLEVKSRKKLLKPNRFVSAEFISSGNRVSIDMWDLIEDLETAKELTKMRKEHVIWCNTTKENIHV